MHAHVMSFSGYSEDDDDGYGDAQYASTSARDHDWFRLPDPEEEEAGTAASKRTTKIEELPSEGVAETSRVMEDAAGRKDVKFVRCRGKVCAPCRKKKRKCNGGRPCAACVADRREEDCVDPEGSAPKRHKTPQVCVTLKRVCSFAGVVLTMVGPDAAGGESVGDPGRMRQPDGEHPRHGGGGAG